MPSRKRFRDLVGKTSKNKDSGPSVGPSRPTLNDDEKGVTQPSGKSAIESTVTDRSSYQDGVLMKSDDSGDESSPLVSKPGASGAEDSVNENDGLEKTPKISSNRNPLSGMTSSESDQSAATLPIQTRVDWVRLASFDRFEDDDPKNEDSDRDLNPSQSESSFPPDASERQTLLSGGKTPRGTDADNPVNITCTTDSPPPSYSADFTRLDNNDDTSIKIDNGGGDNKTDDEVFADSPDKAMTFALLDPSSKGHCKTQTKLASAAEKTSHLRLLAAARTVHATVRMSRLERVRRRAKWAGKKFVVFLVSHIGLTIVVLLYAMAGGFLFRWLEVDSERERRQDMMALRQSYLQAMWVETNRYNVLFERNWTLSMRRIMMDFERRVYKAVTEGTWDGAGHDVITKWTIPGSLLFSTTVITSIGYGDITPRTVAGKLVIIPFAIIGIPLTLLCLANIGQLLAVAFKFCWKRMIQCKNLLFFPKGHRADDTEEPRIPILVCVAIIVGYTLGGAAIFSSWEADWTFLDGFYFSFITLSTIGFGDFVPGQYEDGTNERRVVCTLYLMTGLALLSMVFQLMIDSIRHITRRYAQFFGLTEEQIAQDVRGIGATVQVQEVSPAFLPPEPVIIVTSPDDVCYYDDPEKGISDVCGNHLAMDSLEESSSDKTKLRQEDMEMSSLGNGEDEDAVKFGEKVLEEEEEEEEEEKGDTTRSQRPTDYGASTKPDGSGSPVITIENENGQAVSNEDSVSDKIEIHPEPDGEIEYSNFVSSPTIPATTDDTNGFEPPTPAISSEGAILHSPAENGYDVETPNRNEDSDITNGFTAQTIGLPTVKKDDDSTR